MWWDVHALAIGTDSKGPESHIFVLLDVCCPAVVFASSLLAQVQGTALSSGQLSLHAESRQVRAGSMSARHVEISVQAQKGLTLSNSLKIPPCFCNPIATQPCYVALQWSRHLTLHMPAWSPCPPDPVLCPVPYCLAWLTSRCPVGPALLTW